VIKMVGGLLLALLCASVGAQQEFKIGVVASLSGGFTAPAKDTIDGWRAWEKAHGLPGKKIVLEILDDETNPVSASNAFRRIAADPSVQLIYLFGPSNSVMAVKSLASEFKVPIIAGGAADAIGIPADPWLFKVAPAVRDFMTVLSEYAQKKGYKRIASINATDAFGQAEINALKALAPKHGLTVVAAESFGVEDTSFNAQLTRIRAAKPDIIYNGASGRAAILTWRAFQQMGFKQPLVVTQAGISKAFFDAIGSPQAADGLMTPMQSGVFGGAAAADAKLYGEMEKAIGRTPVYFNTFGFDVGLITEYAVKNSDGTRQGLRDALERIQELPAVNGPVTYTKDDHTGQNYRSIIMGQLKSGKPVPAN
jgi:branched-chain amino acid transport system substrate-binding protein